MRNTILIVGGVALVGFVLGTRANRPTIKARESVRHQLVRLWNDPKARKRRERKAKELRKDAERTGKHLAKAAKRRAKDLAR